MSQEHPHLWPWKLLPKKPGDGKCDVCATAHEPDQPHNQQSLYYQYDFFTKQGRWPTWADAIAHCTEEVKDLWTQALAERGIDVNGGKVGAQ